MKETRMEKIVSRTLPGGNVAGGQGKTVLARGQVPAKVVTGTGTGESPGSRVGDLGMTERVTKRSGISIPSDAVVMKGTLAPLRSEDLRLREGLVFEHDKYVPRFAGPQTVTKLAQSAIACLERQSAATLQQAFNAIETTIRSKSIRDGVAGMMDYLEQKAKISEILRELAAGWTDDTKRYFAEAFTMDSNKTDVMDGIVSLAILNDPDLEGKIRAENTPEATEGDLLEGRRIVWQYPQPGTALNPPYVVLVAVESQDVSQAEGAVESILGALVECRGAKVPTSVAQKLKG
jgi:hypothetical protein